MKKHKGQIWSIDFIVSVVIFIIMITALFFSFDILSRDAQKQNELLLMQDLVLEVTESLVRSPGYPLDWDNETVGIIGLARDENVLDQNKVMEFLNVSYNSSRAFLSMTYYDFNFSIEYLNGSVMNLDGFDISKGIDCSYASDVLAVNRFVILNGSISKLKLVLCKM